MNNELNYNLKKNMKHTIYTNSENQNNSQIFIFELILIDNNNNKKIIRTINKNKIGKLIIFNDNIKYNSINKYILTVINNNCIDKYIMINESINHKLIVNTFINNIIYLEINQSNNNMEFNYSII